MLDDKQIFNAVKIGCALAFAMLFACSLSGVILTAKLIGCGNYCKGVVTIEFLIDIVLITAGALAVYKNFFTITVLDAVLFLLFLVQVCFDLDYRRGGHGGLWGGKGNVWDAYCAKSVAYGLCVLFTSTVAFFIKKLV